MTLNKNAFKISGVTQAEYFRWCKENKKPAYLTSTKTEFFRKIQEGKLVRDSEGKLIKKRKKKDVD